MILSERYRYPVHVWLLGVFVIAPVLYAINETLSEGHNYAMMLYPLFILAYLLPTFGIVVLMYTYLRKLSLELWIKIALMDIVGVGAVLMTMALLRSSTQMMEPTIIFSLSLVIASMLITWKKS